MIDLLEKVMHFIEEESYSALEAIYNAELAKLGKCAAIPKYDARLHSMSDKRVLAARYISKYYF